MTRYQFVQFFRLIYMRLRGPKYKLKHIVPYYGGATPISKIVWSRKHGWSYGLTGVDGNWEFTEGLITFYMDNPNKDGRHYGYRNIR